MEERGETRCVRKLGHGLGVVAGSLTDQGRGDEFQRHQQEEERMDSRKEVISRKTRRAENMSLQEGLSGDFKEVCKEASGMGRRLPAVLTVASGLAEANYGPSEGMTKDGHDSYCKHSGARRKEAPLTLFVDEEADERSLA